MSKAQKNVTPYRPMSGDRARHSAITYAYIDGVSTPLSYRDSITWDFAPYINIEIKSAASCVIRWTSIPEHWRDSVRDVISAYWMEGLPRNGLPKASSVISTFGHLSQFVKWLNKVGVRKFSEVSQIHFAEYVRVVKESVKKPSYQAQLFLAIEKVLLLEEFISDAFIYHPWPSSSACEQANFRQGQYSELQTEEIPLDIAIQLHIKAYAFLDRSEIYFKARDAFKAIESRDYSKGHTTRLHIKHLKALGLTLESYNSYFRLLPAACYTLIALHSGMRISEMGSLASNTYYESEFRGEIYGWLKGKTYKSGERNTEWMINIEIGSYVTAVLEKYAKWYHHKIQNKINNVKDRIFYASESDKPALASELFTTQKAEGKLFVSDGGLITEQLINIRLSEFCDYSEINYHCKSHQFRKTFAVLCVKTGLGDVRYLREHYKHRMLDTSILYAANDRQDVELYEEINEVATHLRHEIIEHWLEGDTSLSGGHAPYIEAQRIEYQGMTKKKRKDYIVGAAKNTYLRGTGHSWCLAESMGCGGHGLYDAPRCGGCSQSLIDDSTVAIWKGIGRQQLELRNVDDIGPGGKQKVEDNILIVADVLKDFGIDLLELTSFPNEPELKK
jgi:site-specific recombinase XerD